MDRRHRSAPPSSRGEIRTASAEETREVGRRLGAAATPGTLLALSGPLGAGKTQLAKGVADGLGVRSVVNSPTFVLMNEHDGRVRLHHIDAYRLDDPEEALGAGLLDDRQGDVVTVLEWADRLSGCLPADRLDIALEPVPESPTARILRWRASGRQHSRLATRAIREDAVRRRAHGRARATEVAAAS